MIDLLKDWPKDEPVPAISLREPWAACLTFLGKDVENRTNWKFKHRGPMVIHASKSKMFREDLDLAGKLLREDGHEEEELLHWFTADGFENNPLLAHGEIVAVANLAAVFGDDADIPDEHPILESPWAEEDAPYWLYFDRICPVVRKEFRGAVGLFKVPYDVVASLEELPIGPSQSEPNS